MKITFLNTGIQFVILLEFGIKIYTSRYGIFFSNVGAYSMGIIETESLMNVKVIMKC